MRTWAGTAGALTLLAGLLTGCGSPASPAGDAGTPHRPLPVDAPIYGVTSDDGYAAGPLAASAEHLSRTPTTRLVFDEHVPATEYQESVRRLRRSSYLMGLILDSYYVKEYSATEYADRVTDYLDAFGDQVDIWEIGNEVNGEWLGDPDDVITKIASGYDQAEDRGHRTAMTLYYNPECWERSDHEMFRWAETHVPERMRTGLDYVWISYYEHDCEGQRFGVGHWRGVFDRLHRLFPNSRIGFGETGADPESSYRHKADYLRRYYGMPITTPGYVGGYFWWYYRQECLPWDSRKLWSVLDRELRTY
ncbi:MAG: hypothetical protein ACRDUA_20810 [Micromonosporaceae bacterium]